MDKTEIILTIIATGITIIGSVIAGVRVLLKKFEKKIINDKRLDDMEKKVCDLPCQSHHDDIISMRTILIQKYPTAASVFTAKHNPRQLNELGKKVFQDIRGEEFLMDNKHTFFEYINEQKPLTALDVENLSYAALLNYTNTPIFNEIKDFVYNAPSIEMGKEQLYDITVNDICYILSIRLRDMYIEEYNIQ